ncbi:MAG: RdgB/HAM1 family non-canonical purine NTP pyrophosphatase [Gammaproteobacteria bacterium]
MRPGIEVVVASSNPGKLREITAILAPLQWSVRPQLEFSVAEAPETGLTFVENALLKARNASAVCGLPAIADDSGIEVDALGGAPGIHSARYAGKEACDRENLEKLIREMAGVPWEQRRCRFHCLMIYLRYPEDPTPLITHGVWEGMLLFEAQGQNGFGYDPLFHVPAYGCSSADLDPAVKDRISHRAQALHELVAKLVSTPRD